MPFKCKFNNSDQKGSDSEHVIQIKSGIMKYVDVNVKIIAHAKKIIIGILVNVFVKMINI